MEPRINSLKIPVSCESLEQFPIEIPWGVQEGNISGANCVYERNQSIPSAD